MRRGRAIAGLLATAMMLFVSTIASPAQQLDITFENIDPELKPYGAVEASAIWTRSIISVCWLNHPEYRTEREWVRDAINTTWEEVSGVRLTGWKDCQTSSNSDIAICVDESGPRSYVGQHVIGKLPVMWLNFSFSAWSQSCQSHKEACIRAIAVHEFGHALGFQHEQLQADAPQACIDHLKQSGQWEVIDTPVKALTAYDRHSVMNYCNSIWSNDGKLSDDDRKAVRILFPQQ